MTYVHLNENIETGFYFYFSYWKENYLLALIFMRSIAMPVIDVHAHVTPQRFQRAVRNNGTWYGMTSADGELENPKNLWTPEERIADMDSLGVDMQAVSPTDIFYQYHRDVETTTAIACEVNDEIAEMTSKWPDRFVGMGTVPMQNIEAAVTELERIVGDHGFKGIMIDDHVLGRTYDEPAFHPFWDAVERLGAVVLFHQLGPTVVKHRTSRYMLPNTIGNLADRAITFGTLVFGGVMDRYPDLKLCLGHGGGYTAFGIARMDKGWEAAAIDYMSKGAREHIDRPPSEYLGRFYYDCCTHSEATLRFLIDTVGIDQVVFGTDYPAPMVIEDSVNWVRGLESLTDNEKEAILSGNTARMLGM